MESSGSKIPFSRAIKEEIILNVEHGELLVNARSPLYIVYRLLEMSYTTAVPFSPSKYSDQSASAISGSPAISPVESSDSASMETPLDSFSASSIFSSACSSFPFSKAFFPAPWLSEQPAKINAHINTQYITLK